MTKKKVLVGGCFDILHIGHIKFLKKAKSFGDYLVVLLESDENIKLLKGRTRPFHNIEQRVETLMSLKFVDEVIKLPAKVENLTYDQIIKRIKPYVIAITEDDPIKNIKALQAKSVDAKLKIIKKYKSHSTSTITNILGL